MHFDDQRVTDYVEEYQKASGKRLTDLRKIRGITQAQLADITSLSQSTVAMAELGYRTPRLAVRMKICAVLSANHDDIWPAPDRIHFAQRTVAA